MNAMASQITQPFIQGVDQGKHQSSASLAFVGEITSDPHKGPVTRKMFPFDDVIMKRSLHIITRTKYIARTAPLLNAVVISSLPP